MNPSTPPKGSLEDLFRYHLLESEAAAVAPRPQVWEQVDNSLLLAQNEKYRRRLAAYRWAVAASLLLASLAGGGWWQSQRQAPTTATLAQATTQQTAAPSGLATARRAATAPLLASSQAPAATTAAIGMPRSNASFSTVHSSAIDQTATLLASAQSATTGLTAAATRQPGVASAGSLVARPATRTTAKARTGQLLDSYSSTDAELAASTQQSSQSVPGSSMAIAQATAVASNEPTSLVASNASVFATQAQVSTPPASGETTQSSAATSAAVASATSAGATAEEMLAARLASLTQPIAGLPTSLAEVAVAPGPPLELSRRWQYGASYSASAYNPNVEWAKAPVVATNNAVTTYQPPTSFSRSVAAEYRDNLHAGLGQRLSLWATRRLGNGRWGLRTGVELAQNTATSASSVAFVGEPVADLSYLQSTYVPRLQRTTYRYRSVSVPAELHYANPLKTGFSFYGRIGAMVTALLNVRSEVEGTPEATRTYSPLAGSTPYRHVSAGLRGGAGMQYRPAGHQWALNFGPVAEMGIFSLNADAGQDFWNQQRPYSFGLEAGMELGRGFRLQ
jgi:hypothetical protein